MHARYPKGVPARPLQVVSTSSDLLTPLRHALAGTGPAILPVNGDPTTTTLLDIVQPDLGVEDDIAVVVGTSGSSGTPKGVALTAAALRASARATHARLGGPGHWTLAVPVHHIGGLQVLVRALGCGAELSTVDMRDGFTPQAFADATAALPEGRRYTALVPTQLRRLLASPDGTDALASYHGVIVGAAATQPEVLDKARAADIGAVPAYGMSETASGCVYDGVPLEGVGIDLVDGVIHISGPMLASGYVRNPAATAQAFTDGSFVTRDVGRWLPDGRLDVLGRVDDLINTGGEKVAPALVERALCTVAQDACVAGIPDPEWGQAVAAAVIADASDDSLKEAVRRAVGRHAVPRLIVHIDAFPTLASGKVDRGAVVSLLQST